METLQRLYLTLAGWPRGPRLTGLIACVLLSLAGPTWAQGQGVVIDVTGARRSAYPLAIPLAVDSDGALAQEAVEIIRFDMATSGFFKVLDPASFLANLDQEKLGIVPAKWKEVGAYGVIKFQVVAKGDRVEFEGKLFEVSKGNISSLGKFYRGGRSDLRSFVHAWCNEVVQYFTGEAGFFGSRLAFSTKQRLGSAIYAMDFDGANPVTMSRNSSTNILPAWSPQGSLAYSSFMRGNPDLYITQGGGRPKRISSHTGMNTGASFSPDGSQLALTLSKDGNPEIYIIRANDGAIVRRLTEHRGIDTSPAWSPDGRQIAFVSDREGGPQIFVVAASGGTPKRVSFNGNYNTTPAWSPRKGVRMLAYTTRDGSVFDIVTIDLDKNQLTRITQNEGSNEEPSFSPNGRALAFTRTGGNGAGIYIANADGTGKAVRVWSGAATSVDWGPAPK